MKRYIWSFAVFMSVVPALAQGPDEAETRDLNIGAQFALGNLALQDFKPVDTSVVKTKLINRTADSDQELINIMGVWAANGESLFDLLRQAQKQMLELIKVIKNTYDLD